MIESKKKKRQTETPLLPGKKILQDWANRGNGTFTLSTLNTANVHLTAYWHHKKSELAATIEKPFLRYVHSLSYKAKRSWELGFTAFTETGSGLCKAAAPDCCWILDFRQMSLPSHKGKMLPVTLLVISCFTCTGNPASQLFLPS